MRTKLIQPLVDANSGRGGKKEAKASKKSNRLGSNPYPTAFLRLNPNPNLLCNPKGC